MGLTRLCLKNPAAAAVVLALITLLGMLSVSQLTIEVKWMLIITLHIVELLWCER